MTYWALHCCPQCPTYIGPDLTIGHLPNVISIAAMSTSLQ